MVPPDIEMMRSGMVIPRLASNPSSWRFPPISISETRREDEGLGEIRRCYHWSTIPGLSDSPGMTSGYPPGGLISWTYRYLVSDDPNGVIPGNHRISGDPLSKIDLSRYEMYFGDVISDMSFRQHGRFWTIGMISISGYHQIWTIFDTPFLTFFGVWWIRENMCTRVQS